MPVPVPAPAPVHVYRHARGALHGKCIARASGPDEAATRFSPQPEAVRERGLAVGGGSLPILPLLGHAWPAESSVPPRDPERDGT